MKRKLLYGSGIVSLAILVALVVWQGSFSFGDYAPAGPEQTYLFWALSTLIFILMVTLGFVLFRTGVKLYIERRSNREGSRLRTKLVLGALALTVVPVFFLVLFSVSVLNYNLVKWFSRPADNIKLNLEQVNLSIEAETRLRAEAQARWLALQPELRDYLATGILATATVRRLCAASPVQEVFLVKPDRTRLPVCPAPAGEAATVGKALQARVPVADSPPAVLVLEARMAVDLAARQHEIERSIREYNQLGVNRKSIRTTYLMLLVLISLFILFAATWLALFLARQISVPISALLEAAGQVRGGNLGYRIQARAFDELASLVRAFNEMTRELERSERELARRGRFTEAILESIPTGVISVTSDGRIQKVNRALSQIFSAEAVAAAQRLEDLLPAEDAREVRYLMNRARRTGLASSQLEPKAGRQTLHLSVTVSALEEQVTSGFVVVLEDTSELLLAQKAAAWHEVARRIAHEMKNPLTPIALCAERIARHLERLSSDGAVTPELVRILRECSLTISAEVETVKTLVDEFSQFARFPAAQPAPSDLNEVVRGAMAVFAGRLDGIQLELDLAEGLPAVNIDRDQFKRVVINLVDNAAEAMQNSLVRRLWVATRAPGSDSVELTIADTGCGVSPEDKEKLFLPYFSTKDRGTGLGLAIVSHILAEHEARIRVEDNYPSGARFIVEVPSPADADAEWKPVESSA